MLASDCADTCTPSTRHPGTNSYDIRQQGEITPTKHLTAAPLIAGLMPVATYLSLGWPWLLTNQCLTSAWDHPVFANIQHLEPSFEPSTLTSSTLSSCTSSPNSLTPSEAKSYNSTMSLTTRQLCARCPITYNKRALMKLHSRPQIHNLNSDSLPLSAEDTDNTDEEPPADQSRPKLKTIKDSIAKCHR